MTTIYTIGHSTRDLDEFVEILKEQKISQLVDVRTIPRSRHNPQYEQSALKKSLPENDIQYIHMENLGGLRPTVKDSQNLGWRNKSFRNYADYMQTDSFKNALGELIKTSQKAPTAIMCAEAVPWRCHRSLIADALLAKGFKAKDIISKTEPKEHKLTSFAKVDNEKVTYPGV